MNRSLALAGALCAASILAAGHAVAGGRPDYQTRSWFGHFGGGWMEPQSDSADIIDSDWTLRGGAMFWPVNSPVGLNIDFAYSNPDLTAETIRRLNDYVSSNPDTTGRIDNGDVQNLQLTFNAVWGPGDSSRGIYLTGGVGYYRLETTVGQVGLVYYPPICDPYYWWCYPGGIGPGNIIRGRQTNSEIGYNLGIGYTFEVGVNQMFVEATYHSVSTEFSSLDYIPITFGIRW
ncbi:MAG: hypothetical protein ACWGPN_03105 [Gammaproteobacteria bacterium]